mmetsp:Transcript_7689/g.18850  ORF Transcript_7689/g.18850 Transcript_7689/m.18850 type:complete len:85 (+) Transcript_7689:544-798(+)
MMACQTADDENEGRGDGLPMWWACKAKYQQQIEAISTDTRRQFDDFTIRKDLPLGRNMEYLDRVVDQANESSKQASGDRGELKE